MGSTSTTEMTGETKAAAATKTKQKVVRKGLAARPYRRLTEEVLTARRTDTAKKLKVHESKIVLLKDKLEQYERETSLREQCDEEE